MDSSGSRHRLKWHSHSPKSFWLLFIASQGVCSPMDKDMTDTWYPYRQGKQTPRHIKMGNVDSRRKSERKGSSNALRDAGGKCSAAFLLQKVPWGLGSVSETVLTQLPPFLMGRTRECLLGQLGA